MEKVDDLHQGLLGLVLAGHVIEGDAGGFLHVHLGVGLAHAADAAQAATLPGHEIHQEHEPADEQGRGQDVGDHELQHRAHLGHIGVGEFHAVLRQQGDQVPVQAAQLHGEEGEVLVKGVAQLVGEYVALRRGDLQLALHEFHSRNLVLLHHGEELAVLDLVGGGRRAGLPAVGGQVVERHRQHQGPGHHNQQSVEIFFVLIMVGIFIMVVVHHFLLLYSAGRP